MRIAHISDIHIRNLRYHDEYRKSFADLYGQLADLRPDLIVNTGDTAHTKVQISPEFVSLASEFFTELGNISPVLTILGNHDLNLKNADRLDAISPIINNVRARNSVKLPLKSGLVHSVVGEPNVGDPNVRFWLYGMTDEHDHPTIETIVPKDRQTVDIGLFHGSVFGAVVDSGFELVGYEADMRRFEGMDFVMMGDIHKRQSFMDGRAWYPGSLIQQNFGETSEKGFLLWDIKSRDDFDVKFHRVNGSRGFYTVSIGADLKIPTDAVIPPDARIRATVDTDMSLQQQKDLERELRRAFSPKDIVSIVSVDVDHRGRSAAHDEAFDPDESYKDRLVDFIKEKSVGDDVLEAVLLIDADCNRRLAEEDERHPHAFWRLNHLAWSNLFNYGDGNVIDMRKANGLCGIFAPNGSGKSSIFDVLLQGLFDRMTKDVPRNIDLINDNRDAATIVVDVNVGDENYIIERQIERVKYGQRKFSEAKEWGKTTLNLYRSTPDGRVELSANGMTRPETEREIRRLVGSFDDFVMTSVVSQNPIVGVPGNSDIISCKESDRRKILFRFLGLESFDTLAELAKEDWRQITSEIKQLELDPDDADALVKLADERRSYEALLETAVEEKTKTATRIDALMTRLAELESIRVPTPADPAPLEARLVVLTQIVADQRSDHDRSVIARAEAVERLAVLTGAEPPSPPMPLSELLSRSTGAGDRLIKIGSRVEKARTKLDAAETASKTIDLVPCEGKFPTCKFLIDAFKAKGTLQTLVDELVHLDADQTAAKDSVEVLRDLVVVGDRHMQWRRAVDATTSEIELLDGRIASTASTLEARSDELERCRCDLDGIRSMAEERRTAIEMRDTTDAVRTDLLTTKNVLTTIEARVASFERQIGALESRAQRANIRAERLRTLGGLSSAHELYAEAMGKYGIPYRILAGMLPLINAEINKILSAVVDFGVYIEHDPSEQTIRLYLQYGDYKSRPLALAGGAEKFIASLAIRTALLSVSRLPKTNVLVVDEGFGKLDPEKLDAVQRMLEHMKTIFDSVFVVSHVDALRDIVDVNIEITVDSDGYAHVEVI